jgi:hypothetical protein
MARFIRFVDEYPAPMWIKVTAGVGAVVGLAYMMVPKAKRAGEDAFSHEKPQAFRGERIRNLEEERKLVRDKQGLAPPSPIADKDARA